MLSNIFDWTLEQTLEKHKHGHQKDMYQNIQRKVVCKSWILETTTSKMDKV